MMKEFSCDDGASWGKILGIYQWLLKMTFNYMTTHSCFNNLT